MSQKTEQRRHEALARETASWDSWTVGSWFTNGAMALMLDDPFTGADMKLEFECACPTDDDRRDHLGDLNRPCVFVDVYERAPEIRASLTKTLQLAMDCRANALVTMERDPFDHPDQSGMVCYRARVSSDDAPRAWVAVQRAYVDAIDHHARPTAWAWLQLPARDGRPPHPVIWALRGEQNQAVGLIMPMTCAGSAIEAVTESPAYTGVAP